MLTRAFNCSHCKKPFGRAEGEPRRPTFAALRANVGCYCCLETNDQRLSQRGLMNFLNQHAFEKTDGGYVYTLPINEPVCVGCYHPIDIFEGEIAFIADCGHYLCRDCDLNRIVRVEQYNYPGVTVLGNPVTCTVCGTVPNRRKPYPPDSLLAAFSSEIKNRRIQELDARFNEKEKQMKALAAEKLRLEAMVEKARLEAMVAKQEEKRGNGAMKNCGDCGIELPVERLYKCKDCDTINCGNCCFDSHREHSVEKLLGIELDQLQKQNDRKYTENLEGLHGNLKYLHNAIDDAVLNVVAVGKECLRKISTSTQYEDAQNIATTIDQAADKFEQHCEEYIPVARRFSTKLTELGEELTEYQK